MKILSLQRMANVLILSERNAVSAPRILREITALESIFEIFVCAAPNNNQQFQNFTNLYSLRSFRDKLFSRFDSRFKKLKLRYSRIDQFIETKNIQVLIIHDPLFIPIATRLKEKFGLKIIFNAHEYHPLEFENDMDWMKSEGGLYDEFYRTYLPKFDLIINVCSTIQEKCKSEYDLQSIVIPNAVKHHNLDPIPTNNDGRIKIIHHGALLPGRKIEKMIDVVGGLSNTHTLDIIGVSNPETIAYKDFIKSLCKQHENIQLLEPLSFDQIVPFINQYDIGLYLLEPSNFNNFNALPNKLFEFIQARLAIAVSPSPEMQTLINKHNIGVVSKDFTVEAMQEALLSLNQQKIIEFKTNSHIAASVENAEKYYQLYLDSVLSLLKN